MQIGDVASAHFKRITHLVSISINISLRLNELICYLITGRQIIFQGHQDWSPTTKP